MLLTLLVVALEFIWLGYETDWLTVRLAAGPVPAPIIEKRQAWDSFDWTRWKPYLEPICGWDWIKSREHIMPDYHFEFKAYGVSHKITLRQPGARILKEIAVSTLHKPRNRKRNGG